MWKRHNWVVLLLFLKEKKHIHTNGICAQLKNTFVQVFFFPTWQMFGVSVSLAKLYLLLCFSGQCTCKLETLTPFETRAASGCFENGHKGSYCRTSFNQAHNTQLAFKLMTLLCISSIDLLFPKLQGKKKKDGLSSVTKCQPPLKTMWVCEIIVLNKVKRPLSSIKAGIHWSQSFHS